VYFAKSNFTILYILSYDMFDYGVSSELLGVGDGGRVITKDIHRVAHTGKHPKLDDELV
jgi:hypothetical protein